MTNREWLNTLTDSELATFMVLEIPSIGRRYTQSITGVAKWLTEEHWEAICKD